MSDAINPGHYRSHPSGIECIDFTRRMSFNRGNALKYIWRAGLKGDRQQDIDKAKWYLRDECFYQLPAVYDESTRESLIALLRVLAVCESNERMVIINRIIFGEWMTLENLAESL